LKFWKVFVGEDNWTDTQRMLAPVKKDAGDAALGVMDEHLNGRRYFVGDQLSIADIALFAYTHTADMGGFDLKAYPNVLAWVDAMQVEPGHVPMEM
jgi:glutathione S-transferase